jgi:hypothetical protein
MTSAARRVLPSPAAPSTVTRTGARSATARSKHASSRASSSCLPTKGVSKRRSNGGAPSRTAGSRYAGTGSALPLRSSGAIGSSSTASRTRRLVSSPSRIAPGAAACSRRAATLTASPVAKNSPPAESPATTSPVLMPVRTSSVSPRSCESSSFRPASASRISAAARTARRAPSSCSSGIPKTAIIASPMNFSTVPPWRSNTVRISSK